MHESSEAAEILAAWLGPEAERDAPSDTVRRRWFDASAELDAQLARRFGRLLERAARGDCDGWAATLRGRLALVIVLDQFTRNIQRDTARMFENDAKALALAEPAVAAGEDRALRAAERQFLYLPFMHAEALEPQRRSLSLFEQLARDAPHLDSRAWARRHHDIVERFGHFPHRSRLLGRTLSAEELEFLAQPGSSF